MWKEFKEFISRGSVVDLAVGVIIGAAFGAVVTSLVNDIIMPPIGMLLGRVNFADLFISLNGQPYPSLAAAKAAGAPTVNYGNFVNTVLSFLVVALVIFFLVKAVNRLRRPAPAPAPAAPVTKKCAYCATDIPVKAVRCPNCTSELKGVAAGAR
jgi:large conductance mechanosensitive channel